MKSEEGPLKFQDCLGPMPGEVYVTRCLVLPRLENDMFRSYIHRSLHFRFFTTVPQNLAQNFEVTEDNIISIEKLLTEPGQSSTKYI